MQEIKDKIRNIKDFPKEGIVFRDITTAIKDAETMKKIIDYFVEKFKDQKIDYVAGPESRGFIFGMPVAYQLGCGFIPIRKPGKLPAETISIEYDLEYGKDKIEMHKDAIEPGSRVLLMDDLLATGGTAAACVDLINSVGKVVGAGFMIELVGLGGMEKLPSDIQIETMVKFDEN